MNGIKRMYVFQNDSMEKDIVDSKGRPVIYARVAVIATSFRSARVIYGSQEVGTDKKGEIFRIEDRGPLPYEWELTDIWTLGPNWN